MVKTAQPAATHKTVSFAMNAFILFNMAISPYIKRKCIKPATESMAAGALTNLPFCNSATPGFFSTDEAPNIFINSIFRIKSQGLTFLRKELQGRPLAAPVMETL